MVVENPSIVGPYVSVRHASSDPITAERAPVRRSAAFRLAVFAGARPSVLAQVPQEADRFTPFLWLFIATAAVSGVSMAFAIATAVLHDSPWAWFAAVLVGLLWATVIFIIDRALTASMRSTRSTGQMIANILPRLLLAFVIGVVVSEPLVLQVFDNDIQAQMSKDNQGRLAELRDGLEPLRIARDEEQEKVTQLQLQMQTGNIQVADSQESQATVEARDAVSRLEAEVAAQRSLVAAAEALYTCSTDPGAPWVDGCVRDANESWGYFFDNRTAAQDALATSQSQLQSARATLGTFEQEDATLAAATQSENREAARRQLPDAQTRLSDAQAALDLANQEIEQVTESAKGLLNRMHALTNLSAADNSVLWAHVALFLLFLFIECMPVIVKAFRSWGDPNPYELAEAARTVAAKVQREDEEKVHSGGLQHARDIQTDSWDADRERARRHREAADAAAFTVEQDMLDREVDLGLEQNARVASRMETVTSAALNEWEQQVDRMFSEDSASEIQQVSPPDQQPRPPHWSFEAQR